MALLEAVQRNSDGQFQWHAKLNAYLFLFSSATFNFTSHYSDFIENLCAINR